MTDFTTYDAVVIGAGPAGSVAARELARRGASVLLVERAAFPRPKVCGCCLNDAAVATLAAVGLGDLPRRCGAVPLTGVRVAAGRRSADLPLPGVAVSREAFDVALRDAAVKAGATALHGVRATLGALRDGGREITLIGDGGARTVTARVVVVANGLGGRLDPGDPAFDTLPAAGSRIGAGVTVPPSDGPDFYAPGRVFMATAPGGYVGLVRLEDGRLDLAAAFDAGFVRTAGGLGHAAAAVLASVGWPLPPNVAGLPWKGTPTLTRRPRAVAGPRWFAVGDAAGYVEPFTGEGMAWAVQSAVALAPIAFNAVGKWADRRRVEWEDAHARLLGNRRWTCRAVARVLRSPGATAAAVRVLAALPGLARPVVARLNRPAAPFHVSHA